MTKYKLLRNLLRGLHGATFISIDTLTRPDIRKTLVIRGKSVLNPFYGHVLKQMTTGNVIIFQNKHENGYENMVQRRLIDEWKDPTLFDLKPRQWGKRIANTPFIEHHGKHYLEVIFLRRGDVQFFFDGRSIDKRKVLGLVEHEESEQGGLDRKVIIRSYACENITGVFVNHRHHRLTSS